MSPSMRDSYIGPSASRGSWRSVSLTLANWRFEERCATESAGSRARDYNRIRMRRSCFALLLLASLACPSEKIFAHRWVYVSRRLRSDQDIEDIRQIARTAAE